MSTEILARSSRATTPYTLYRVFADDTTEPVSGTETTDPVEGIEHGHRLSRLEPGAAFTLNRGDQSVYRFNHKALRPRLALGRVGALLPVLS